MELLTRKTLLSLRATAGNDGSWLLKSYDFLEVSPLSELNMLWKFKISSISYIGYLLPHIKKCLGAPIFDYLHYTTFGNMQKWLYKILVFSGPHIYVMPFRSYPRLSAMCQRYMAASKFLGVDIHNIFEVLESHVNSIRT